MSTPEGCINCISREICETGKQITASVNADGIATRALISQINDATLNRQLSDARAEIIELRNDGRADRRARENEVNITQTVNTNQQQAQAQAQLQGIVVGFNRLCDRFDALQNQVITSKTVNIGSGTAASNTSSTQNHT